MYYKQLFNHYPDKNEGKLSSERRNKVSNNHLKDICIEHKLFNFIKNYSNIKEYYPIPPFSESEFGLLRDENYIRNYNLLKLKEMFS